MPFSPTPPPLPKPARARGKLQGSPGFQCAMETISTNRARARPRASAGPGRAARMLARAAVRRCPGCGSAGIFANYLLQKPSCPACHLRLDRGERDFFIGAYTINLIVAELLVVFGGLAVVLATWPEVPWNGVMWGLMVLLVVMPVVLYPFSRQLWLAVDLIFRPAEAGDYDRPE